MKHISAPLIRFKPVIWSSPSVSMHALGDGNVDEDGDREAFAVACGDLVGVFMDCDSVGDVLALADTELLGEVDGDEVCAELLEGVDVIVTDADGEEDVDGNSATKSGFLSKEVDVPGLFL